MSYLYHRVPENMVGEVLYPLNQLKEKHPDVYANALRKYQGREMLLERTIPKLNCLWNDALHFSSLDPKEVKEELEKNGRSMIQGRFYKIDPNLLERDRTVVYLYRLPTPGGVIPEADIVSYDPADISKYAVFPEETKKYYADTIAQGGNPLLWHLVPHFLYKGTLDVSKAEGIEV